MRHCESNSKGLGISYIHIVFGLSFSQLAYQLYQTIIKRFSQSKKVWIGGLSFYMKQGNLEKGRKLLQRSLKTLPKRKRKKIYLVMGNMPRDLIGAGSGSRKANVTLC